MEAEENWLSASKKFTALLLFVGASSIVVVMLGLVVSSDAGSKQKEFVENAGTMRRNMLPSMSSR